jgi:hypothetical protein
LKVGTLAHLPHLLHQIVNNPLDFELVVLALLDTALDELLVQEGLLPCLWEGKTTIQCIISHTHLD